MSSEQQGKNFLDVASFNSVIEMERKIQEYEQQVKQMEKQYGFTQDQIEEEEQQKLPPKMTMQNSSKKGYKSSSIKQQGTQRSGSINKKQQQQLQSSSYKQSSLKKQSYNNNKNFQQLDKLAELDQQKQRSMVNSYKNQENRYEGLKNIEQEEMEEQGFKTKPQISEKWKKMTEDQPDSMVFYDKEKYQGGNRPDYIFGEMKADLDVDEECFNDCVANFGQDFLQGNYCDNDDDLE